MTEKRFTYFKSKIGFGKQGIDDNLKGYTFDFTMDNVLDCMNDLSEENEKLRFKNRGLQSELQLFKEDVTYSNLQINKLADENNQLKQFKEYVFTIIDMHLRMLPNMRDNEFNEEDGDPSLYDGAICMLETLKKELQE